MSTSERLEMAAFERLLDVHGSRVERWPEASREPLRRLLASSEVARARWAEAEHLDALLDAVPEIEPTPELMARIRSLPARHPRARRAPWWPFQSSLAPLFGWGAAAALGVVMGVMSPDFANASFGATDPLATGSGATEGDERQDAAQPETAAADDDGADDWTDMSGLAMGTEWASEDD
jgi:hypothetical protein